MQPEKTNTIGRDPITVESVVLLRVENEKRTAERKSSDLTIFQDEAIIDNRNCILNALLSFVKDNSENLTKMANNSEIREYTDLLKKLGVSIWSSLS